MTINITVQFEAFGREGDVMPGAAWWAESAELPGFSAVASSLAELRNRVLLAVADILEEQGRDIGDAELRFTLAPEAPATGAEPAEVTTKPLVYA